MKSITPREAGWYLGLRYMQGEGLIMRSACAVDDECSGVQFIYVDDVLLKAEDWQAVLHDWWHRLAISGYLILFVPDCRHRDSAGARLTAHDLSRALDDLPGWQLVEDDIIDGCAYIVWRKREDGRQLRTPWRKQPNHILVARTGAFGDVLMAASVLPYLKEQGATITFISKSQGVEVLRHDPHVDELVLLAEGQVPEEEMPFYWQAWEARYDRFINLTHSIEGELLKQPWRADYFWSEQQRRALCSRSYLAQIHALAQVPGPYRVMFYENAAEGQWADDYANSCGDFTLWSLRGSAVHKWWPYLPEAICRLLSCTSLTFVLTGGPDAAPLAEAVIEAVKKYHGDVSRVRVLAGTCSIRQVMALAQRANLVIGPETGVMHAVSMQCVPKILMLSHSSAKNIGEDWVATSILTPRAPCHPCHRLHYGHEWCPQDEDTLASACATSISANDVVEAVLQHTQQRKTA